MCEIRTAKDEKCTRKSIYMVHVKTVPQPLGPDGAYGMETADAGRSNTTCAQHVAKAVDALAALAIVRHGAKVTVHRFAQLTSRP